MGSVALPELGKPFDHLLEINSWMRTVYMAKGMLVSSVERGQDKVGLQQSILHLAHPQE